MIKIYSLSQQSEGLWCVYSRLQVYPINVLKIISRKSGFYLCSLSRMAVPFFVFHDLFHHQILVRQWGSDQFSGWWRLSECQSSFFVFEATSMMGWFLSFCLLSLSLALLLKYNCILDPSPVFRGTLRFGAVLGRIETQLMNFKKKVSRASADVLRLQTSRSLNMGAWTRWKWNK